MRLACGVAQNRRALRQCSGEHDVLRRRHAGLVEQNVGTTKRMAAQHKLAVKVEARAQRLQAKNVGVDAPPPYLVTAGMTDADLSFAGKERPHEDDPTACLLHERGVWRG